MSLVELPEIAKMSKVDLYRFLKEYLRKFGAVGQARSIAHFFDDILDNKVLIKNKVLEDIHRGKRCFVFGTGLSVNDIDMSLLAQEYSFGSNFLNYHKDFQKLNVNFYASVSPPSLLRNVHLKATYTDSKIYSEKDVEVWLNEQITLVSYSFDPEVFFPKLDYNLNKDVLLFFGADCRKSFQKRGLFRDKQVFYLKPHKPVLEAAKQRVDISERITFYYAVAFFMLAVVLYMGFEEIYLVGYDYSFEPCLEFHFYDSLLFSKKMDKNLTEKLMNRVGEKRNIKLYKIEEDGAFYRPVYVRYDTDRSAHIAVNDFIISKGVKIYNIVPDGFESPVYEKVSWKYVVENVLPTKRC